MKNVLKISTKKPNKCAFVFWIFAVLILIISIFLWIGFPSIFTAIVHSQLKLSQGEDGQLSKTTFLWSKPPIKTLMNFYIYNVTNVDRITFFGEKPAIVEVGPFAIWEVEDKKDYLFNEDQTKVWYKNYKSYIYDRELSCDVCDYDAIVSIPNLPGLGAYQELANPKYNISNIVQQVFSIGVMLMGEYSFVDVKFGELLFDGYEDALLSAAHSDLVKIISLTFNISFFGEPTFIPIPVPDMKKLAFFYHYNNTNDEEYWIDTGKSDVNNLGKVISWGNLTLLPDSWYTTKQSRMINGSDSGTFQHPNLKETDQLQLFMSFLCRSFNLQFSHEANISGIPTYEFHTPPSVFDTTLEENIGMQYENLEKINYVPNWPNCLSPKNTSFDCNTNIYLKIDCRIGINFCHPCCNGTFYNGTFLLPPGIFPLKCYPGQLKQPPFTVFISAPHFSYSPPELVNTVVGLNPKLPEYTPFMYNHEPTSGMVTKVIFQFQISAPIYQNRKFIVTSNMANALLPFIRVSAEGNLKPNALDLIRMSFVTIPLIIFWVKIVTAFIAILFAFLGFAYNYLKHRNDDVKL